MPDDVDGTGAIECRFPRLPLRPRQYVLRLSITDSYQLASYDLVTAGTAIRGERPGQRRRRAGRRRRRPGVAAVRVRASRERVAAGHGRDDVAGRLLSIPHGGSAGNVLRTGLVVAAARRARPPTVVIVSPLVERRRRSSRSSSTTRVRFEDLPPHRPAGLEGRLVALVQAAYIDSGVTESVRIRRAGSGREGIDPMDSRASACSPPVIAPSMVRPATRYDMSDRLIVAPVGRVVCSTTPPGAARRLEPRADLFRDSAAAYRGAAPRAIDGRRSELGQFHQQADAGAPRQPARSSGTS